jgi:YjbE family integral membrane protein
MWAFLSGVATIFGLNLVLSGDNGVVIAMAAAKLPHGQIFRAIAIAVTCATVLLIIAVFFASQILHLPFLRLMGGVGVIWIGINLFRDQGSSAEADDQPRSLWKTVWLIVLADVSMSTDNVLAIAAIAKGDLLRIAIGLGLGVPVVVFASGLLSRLTEKYPAITYLGGALLGSMGVELALTDPWTLEALRPSPALFHWAQAAGACSVIVAGWLLMQRRRAAVVEE